MHERNRQSFDARRTEIVDVARRGFDVEFADHVALRIDPLGNAARVGERGQRIGLFHVDPAEQRTGRPSLGQVQRVFEALGDEEAHAGAFALEHRIGGDGRSVQDKFDITRRDAGLFADEPHALGDADRLILGRRRRLGLIRPLRDFIVQQQVGECASHIDAESHSHPLLDRHSDTSATVIACAFIPL